MPAPAKIFVIDDDDSVRISLGRLLHSAGYGCTAFASAEDFLEFLEHQAPLCAPAFAIVDIHMPGTDGIELTLILRATYPLVHVVLITAASDPNTATLVPDVPLLQKPFDDVALLDAIAALGATP